ncbi:MAG: hypothetical protein LUQ07_05575 [Methanospirillum sp.]|nr:hypothetical protein [Methanospirillum sp.]
MKKRAVIPCLLNVSVAQVSMDMFGLPDVTILTVGGAVVISLVLLIFWGFFFRGED